MRRLVYISRSLVDADPSVIAGILAVSATRNLSCGVTGMLWWSRDAFAQVLEGEPDAVEDTMGRIARDPRHTDIDIVEARDVMGRLFGHWGMLEADAGVRSTAGTAYLVGFCARQEGRGARRLFDFLLENGS